MSSDNPFDVFAADFKAAIPSSGDKAGNQNDQPINIMAAPTPAPVPVMNTPVMNQSQQQQQPPMAMNGMSMNGMGMVNGQQPGGMYGGGGSFGMSNPMQQPSPYGAQPPAPMTGSMQGGAMIPSAQQSNPYSMSMGGAMPSYAQPMMGQQPPPPVPSMGMSMAAPQFGAPAPTMAPPVADLGTEAPVPQPESAPESAPVFPPPSNNDPFGASPVPPVAAAVSADPFAPPPAEPIGMPPAPPVSADPFGAPPATAAPPLPPASDDPWAQPSQPAPPAPVSGGDAIVPVPNGFANDDPFGVFNQAPPPSDVTPNPTTQYTSEQVLAAADDPWSSGPFASDNNAAPAPAADFPASTGEGLLGDDANVPVGADGGQKDGELPPGGEWYDARIFTPTLGVMFFKPQELTDSLFLQTDKSLVNALDDRPVVAFIVEGSSARAAGVELGHVLLKVNGIDVKNPKEASRLIKEGPRPLPLLFYVPDTNVVVAEGEHMVKYDTRDTTAPNSAKDWKPKYVVIGGIIAQPWMMNMYRSKSEYDIAVIETQARRPVSVKVKQFSLQGARIQNDWQGPQMVKYKNKLHPWKYIVILPISRNPIKISSPNLTQLKPVHEGIRRVLMAQQRHAPAPSRSDPYAGQHDGGNAYSGQQQPPQHYSQPPPPQQYGQQGQYGGPPPQQQQYGYGNDQYNPAGGVGSARRRVEY